MNKKLTFFAALCFFLSAVEAAIPRPLPFFRLGLANIPVMMSFVCMSKKQSWALVLLKVALQGLAGGTLFSYITIFSLAGTIASALAMMILYNFFYNVGLVSWTGISLAGALANNLAQLVAAYFIMFGSSVKVFAPWMLSISFVSAILLGFFVQRMADQSKFMELVKAESKGSLFLGNEESSDCKTSMADGIYFILGALGFIAMVAVKKAVFAAVLFLLFAALSWYRTKKISVLPSLIIISCITLVNLLTPYGRILFSAGTFHVTAGALEGGFVRGAKLCTMVFISRTIISPTLKLPGKAGLFVKNVFAATALLSQNKIKFSKNFIQELDSHICSCWEKL